jgi:hypothetical protein
MDQSVGGVRPGVGRVSHAAANTHRETACNRCHLREKAALAHPGGAVYQDDCSGT